MANNTFSIDLNEKFTRLAQAQMSKDKIEVTALGQEETVPFYYSTDTEQTIEKQAAIITHLQSQLKIKETNVHVVIPDIYTYAQIIEMPKLNEKELLAAIRYQADEFIPMPIENTNIDIEILREDPKTKKLLIFIVASPKKLVDQVKRTIEAANLIPQTLENELSSVGRIVSNFFQQKRQPAIIVNFGYAGTSLYLYDGQSMLINAVRNLKIGYELFIKDIRVNLNWDYQKAEEILLHPQPNSINIEPITGPLFKEFTVEVEKFMLLAREKYAMNVQQLYTLNYDNKIVDFNKRLQDYFSLPCTSMMLSEQFITNNTVQPFLPQLSSFIPVIGSNLW